MKDYSGVATKQLLELFNRLKPSSDSIEIIAARAKMNCRTLKRVVVYCENTMTGLDVADRILLAIGEDIVAHERTGAISVIPMNNTTAARKMAIDALWAEGVESPTPEQIKERALWYVNLREKILDHYA